MGIELKEPLWLLLHIPLVVLLTFFIRTFKQSKQEKIVILCLRFLSTSLLIFALCVPSIVMPSKGENVVFLADQSASASGNEDRMFSFVKNQIDQNKKENDQFGVLSFGEDTSVEKLLDTREELFSEWTNAVEIDETNLEDALYLSTELLANQENGRIVVMSDGKETIGDSKELLPILKSRNISVDWLQMNGKVKEDVSISEMSISSFVYEGEKATIQMMVYSTTEKRIQVRLSLNDQEIIKKDIEVKEGENLLEFEHSISDTGLLVFKGEVIASHDAYGENNEMYSISRADGPPKVMLVENPLKPSVLKEILSNAGFIVEAFSPEQLPNSLTHYLQHQTILFDNVAATSITEKQMKLIEQSVKEFGRGFIMFGGEDSYALGGYYKTPIERLLPVDMDIKGKKEIPSLGLMIVLDRSGSMDGGKLTLAKEAAARTVQLLREEDTLGVIAFDDRPWEIVQAEPIKNKEEVENQIRSISPGGGTEIYSSLELAYEKLSDLELKRKHIILLTDGQSATSGSYETLISNGKDENITISTVAIGNGADRYLLESMATWGNGRFYDVVDASVIPSILSRETVMTTRTYIEDNPFYPNVHSSEWSQLFTDGTPRMNAYIATTPKGTASLPILSEKEDPIVASWQYGLGRTYAFTSDTTGQWSGDWPLWDNWPEFMNKLVTESLPTIQGNPYSISVHKESGKKTTLTIKNNENNPLPIATTVISEDGTIIPSSERILSPGTFEVEFEENLDSGLYYLNIEQSDGNAKVSHETGFSVPYSKEFTFGSTNHNKIVDLIQETGGKEVSLDNNVFRQHPLPSSERQDIQTLLLVIGFLLFFLDIVVRRFGSSFIYSRIVQFFRMRQQQEQTGQQLETLKRKKDFKGANRRELRKDISMKLPEIQRDTENQSVTPKSSSIQKREKDIQQQSKREVSKKEYMEQLLQAKRKRGK